MGSFGSAPASTTTTTTIALTLDDITNGASVVFTGTVAPGGPPDTLTFAGTGTVNISGVEYATIVADGFTYGVEQQDPLNLGKGTTLFAVFEPIAIPEPSTRIAGLGLVVLAGIALRHRRTKRSLP
ncbi:MAG: hypothetical protein WB992_22855 [Bryobacteraceae bacterium]